MDMSRRNRHGVTRRLGLSIPLLTWTAITRRWFGACQKTIWQCRPKDVLNRPIPGPVERDPVNVREPFAIGDEVKRERAARGVVALHWGLNCRKSPLRPPERENFSGGSGRSVHSECQRDRSSILRLGNISVCTSSAWPSCDRTIALRASSSNSMVSASGARSTQTLYPIGAVPKSTLPTGV